MHDQQPPPPARAAAPHACVTPPPEESVPRRYPRAEEKKAPPPPRPSGLCSATFAGGGEEGRGAVDLGSPRPPAGTAQGEEGGGPVEMANFLGLYCFKNTDLHCLSVGTAESMTQVYFCSLDALDKLKEKRCSQLTTKTSKNKKTTNT